MKQFAGKGKSFIQSVPVVIVLLAMNLPASGMTFNVTYDSSVTGLVNAARVEGAFSNATQVFQSLYTNAMTVNLTVYFSSGGTLGQSSTALTGNPTYAQLTNALRAARTTAADSNSVASLPPTDPTPNYTAGTNWWIPTAEAKALNGFFGVATNDSSQDGSITFLSTVSYTYDATNRAVPNEFDFIGVAEHEISEVLGRIYSLNVGGGGYVPYDLFRFTNSGARSFNFNDTNVYFSVDGGVTALKFFYANINFGDIQDWQTDNPADAYDAFLTSGQKASLSSADLTAVDILGYKLSLPPIRLVGAKPGANNFRVNFTNVPGLNFSVLASTNIALSVTNWTVLGSPTENPAGQYQFTDSTTNKVRFYRVRLN